MSDPNRNKIIDNWEKVWSSYTVSDELDWAQQLIWNEFQKNFGALNLRNALVLDAGSGPGTVTKMMTWKYSCKGVLLDTSKEILEKTASRGSMDGCRAIQGSIFELPFKNESFDLVWNGGVLEHFTGHNQKTAVSEMVRVLKPGGSFFATTPYFWSPFYRVGKWYAEKKGKWEVGEEFPVKTLKPLFNGLPVKNIRSYSIGFNESLMYTRVIPWFTEFRLQLRRFSGLFDRCHIGGWLLVTMAEKIRF
jgi:SAM-dependent methyltransferase